jgi:hypothetical protein
MPDPLVYLKAIGTAAFVSGLFVVLVSVVVLVSARRRRHHRRSERPSQLDSVWLNSACIGGIGFGLVCGYHVLSMDLVWPPANGLDRFMSVVIPVTLVIEFFAGFERVPRWFVWLLRVSFAASIPRILLHGSVYLSDSSDWTPRQAALTPVVCATLLVATWALLSRLSQRSPNVSIPLALVLAVLGGGLTIMMAGYIKGGEAAFPLAAVVVGTAIAAAVLKRCSKDGMAPPVILGIAVVGLFGVLFIGHFFGRLSMNRGLAVLLAPLLCWATEVPWLRKKRPSVVGAVRLTLVAVPIVVVLVLAKREFDREMAPLLGSSAEVKHSCPSWRSHVAGVPRLTK